MPSSSFSLHAPLLGREIAYSRCPDKGKQKDECCLRGNRSKRNPNMNALCTYTYHGYWETFLGILCVSASILCFKLASLSLDRHHFKG